MKVSFEGYGERAATFYNNATNPAAAGDPVYVTGNGEVSVCSSGKIPAGVAISANDDYAVVQTEGFVRLPYSGDTAPAVGFATLAADGTGGVTVPKTGGASFLVLEVDTSAETVGLIL